MFARKGLVGAIVQGWNGWLRRHGREAEQSRGPQAAVFDPAAAAAAAGGGEEVRGS
jgi:hypothetical protein